MCEVVNITDEYDVYVGRGYDSKTGLLSKWGNPYSHKNNTLAIYKVNSKKEAIESFEKYLLNNKELFNSLLELKYKKIACFCKSKMCHAYILKKYVDKLENLDIINNNLEE
jgi:hypothetical protein